MASIMNPIQIEVGALGFLQFEPGYWIYVGSAFGTGSTSLENRIRRHLSSEKTLHWHIDFLLDVTGPPEIVVWAESPQSVECKIAERLLSHPDFTAGPRGFGSSDCRSSCTSHIFHFKKNNVSGYLHEIFQETGLVPMPHDTLPT